MSDEKPMGQVIQIDEARIRDHLGEMVRGTVEETLNAMLDAEADQLCGAGRYERSKARRIPGLAATSGLCRPVPADVNLRVPKAEFSLHNYLLRARFTMPPKKILALHALRGFIDWNTVGEHKQDFRR